MNINILRYSLCGIAGGQEVDHNFCKIFTYPLNNDCNIVTLSLLFLVSNEQLLTVYL